MRSAREALNRLLRSGRDQSGEILTDWQEARDALSQRPLRGDAPVALDIFYVIGEEEMEVGMFVPFAGVALPANGKYLWCDGGAFDSVAYPELAAAVGIKYNLAADAAGVRRTPPMSGRVAAGPIAGRTALPDWRPGERRGAEEVRLRAVDVPSHEHAVSEAAEHTHVRWARRAALFAAGSNRFGVHITATGDPGTTDKLVSRTDAAGAHVHEVTGGGGEASHPNVQPILVENWIVRARP